MLHETNKISAYAQRTAFLYRPLSQVVILAALALIAYSNSFNVPFLFDDEPSISENPVIQHLANFFTNRSGYDDHPNRFVGYLTFALNYHFGGLNVVGYHVVNLAIHIFAACLVYALVRLTLQTPIFGTRDSGLGTRNSKLETRNFLPFLAALLFVAHPVQTQAVTYIVQRLTSLATLFYLASLVLHIRWRLAREAGAPFSSRSVLPFYLLSLIAAVLAMKTKEIAFTLPFVVLLYEFTFFGRGMRKHLDLLIPMLCTTAIIPLTMINLQKSAGQIISDVSAITKEGLGLTRWEYLCTQFNVIVTYLRLLVFPVHQNLDYDYPVSHSLMEPRTFLSLLLLMALLGFAVWLWRKSSPSPESRVPGPELRLAAFGIFWFFISLSVESSVIPIADVMFEHRLYLPSVGFMMAVVGLTAAVTRHAPSRQNQALLVLATIALLFLGATFARNQVWRDGETLWRDAKTKSPKKTRPYLSLGTWYGRQERIADALREYEAAIRLDPEEPQTLSNLVLLYLSADRPHDAQTACRTLLRTDPEMRYNLKLYDILRMPDSGDPALRRVREVCR